MTRSVKNQPASRPPVDALQYEKLALSAFDLCDRQLAHLDTLITLASSICRNPAITRDERRRRQTLLELLVDTAEEYQLELECDRELFQVIALDAKGVPRSCITAKHATKLLAETSQKTQQTKEPTNRANVSRRKVRSKEAAVTAKSILVSTKNTKPQPVAAAH
ncbi:hypothetical protein [Paraburkholderia antibiotica]|uniref:Uncharacterized protein n=1 Tax=Paraburkholderia antibiotica TaxID=2728839 RepID=A0A7Y0A2A0_9BURK|nr:hypothetical protein [Paraburkholderia antibiotica]NML35184.1 hypothetical protein [Paraburkholderia antibiotica]